jgi:predicted  nucleic acid-binding Zn-ribbon protein
METNVKQKIQIDSLKRQLAAVKRDKSDADMNIVKLSEELDKKMKLVADLQKKYATQQNSLISLESVAKEQLHLLANQSEAAIDGAHQKLLEANSRLKEFYKFVQVCAVDMLHEINNLVFC